MATISIPTQLIDKISGFSPTDVSSVIQKITSPGCGLDPIIKAADKALDDIFAFLDGLLAEGDGVFDQLTAIAGGVTSLINDAVSKALDVFGSLPQIGAKLIDKVGQLLMQLLGGLDPTDLINEIVESFPSVDLNSIFGDLNSVFENINQFDLCKIIPNIQLIDGEEITKAIPALQSVVDAISSIELPEFPTIPDISQPLDQIVNEFYQFIDTIPAINIDLINENFNTAYKSFADTLTKINVPDVITAQIDQVINQGVQLTDEFSQVLNKLTDTNELTSKLNNQLPKQLKVQMQADLDRAITLASSSDNQFALTQLGKIKTIISKV